MIKKIFIFFTVIVMFLVISNGNVLAAATSPLGGGGCPSTSLYTAIGCVPIDSGDKLVAFLLRWGIGVGSGIAFLLIAYAGFLITTSAGSPDRLKAGQELLTSAIGGLILLVLSVFILNIIGVKILAIPGL